MRLKLKKLKVILGTAWTFGFILLIFVLAFVFSPEKFSLGRIKTFFSSNRSDSADYTGPSTLLHQKVVEEESATIRVVEKVSPSVVSIVRRATLYNIFSGAQESEEGIGTGFIVDENGLVVTNSHVVDEESAEYSVVLGDGSSYEVDAVHLDESSDLAILEITARKLPIVEFGDSDKLKVGQRAIAIGNALGKYANTVTTGVVSGVARQLRASGAFGTDVKVYENAIQTDAALNPGNSGGPLLNSAGQVIGINVATTMGADNISFAIPVNDLKPLLEVFIAEGRIVRPYIGVQYQMVTKEISEARDMPVGVYITRVFIDSPADDAGLERGDIITEFDGVTVDGDFSLSRAVARKKVGDVIDIVVDRNGSSINAQLELEEMPARYGN
jgi:serine protease Do